MRFELVTPVQKGEKDNEEANGSLEKLDHAEEEEEEAAEDMLVPETPIHKPANEIAEVQKASSTLQSNGNSEHPVTVVPDSPEQEDTEEENVDNPESSKNLIEQPSFNDSSFLAPTQPTPVAK